MVVCRAAQIQKSRYFGQCGFQAGMGKTRRNPQSSPVGTCRRGVVTRVHRGPRFTYAPPSIPSSWVVCVLGGGGRRHLQVTALGDSLSVNESASKVRSTEHTNHAFFATSAVGGTAKATRVQRQFYPSEVRIRMPFLGFPGRPSPPIGSFDGNAARRLAR